MNSSLGQKAEPQQAELANVCVLKADSSDSEQNCVLSQKYLKKKKSDDIMNLQ